MNNQIFIPENESISKIFNCDQIYRIPNYQRQYSWDDEKLEILWSDLYENYQNQNHQCYFLGSIVVVKSDDYLDLIDGQQRLTTLIIMMDVLRKNFSFINQDSEEVNFVDLNKLNTCILHGKKNRLQLQSDPNFDVIFNSNIIKRESYTDLSKPTKQDLKKDAPVYKYLNTACFFYHKFKSLKKEELERFVNYIFFKTNIIKIICTDESFAIKLFQVLNDRGMDLSNADLVKTEIYSKYDKDDDCGKNSFNTEWNKIVNMANQYDFKMDDFIVYYEYFKLKANPKRQVVEEIKAIIKNQEPYDVILEMVNFSEAIKKVYDSTHPIIYSLRYIPWKAYVMTALASAYYVNYPEMNQLLDVIRRFFYISFISGGTLNTIKQTSFKLIENIINKKDINEISSGLEQFIISKRMVSFVYDALDSDVYDEKFLKPLLLSLDYKIREETNTTFYEIDRYLHMDHILPRAYKKNRNHEWDYIQDTKEADRSLNTLGNMALLYYNKNEECENFGFETKLRIYQGKNLDGSNKTGVTSYETTRIIIQNAEQDALERMKKEESLEKKYIWDVESIQRRREYLLTEIEDMLHISRDDIASVYDENEVLYQYQGRYYDGGSLIQKTLGDFMEENHYEKFSDVPMELYQFLNQNQILKVNEQGEEMVDVGGLSNFSKMTEYLAVLKKYFVVDVFSLDDSKVSSKLVISESIIREVYVVSKNVYDRVVDSDDALKLLVQKGMNRTSAAIYVDDFLKMMQGEEFKRAISALAADIFITNIRKDYGSVFSQKAIQALGKNIEYQRKCGIKNNKLVDVYKAQQKKEEVFK